MKRVFSQNVFFEENKLPWVICTLTCECTRIATTYNIGVTGSSVISRYIKQIHHRCGTTYIRKTLYLTDGLINMLLIVGNSEIQTFPTKSGNAKLCFRTCKKRAVYVITYLPYTCFIPRLFEYVMNLDEFKFS